MTSFTSRRRILLAGRGFSVAGKGRSSKEATAIVQVGDAGSWTRVVVWESDFGYMLKAKPTGFPAGWDVGCEKQRRRMDPFKVSSLSTWKDGGFHATEGNRVLKALSPQTHMRKCPTCTMSVKEDVVINAGEGVEKREPSCTVGGNVN